MTQYTDAIIHVADLPALIGYFAQTDPSLVLYDENNQPVGLNIPTSQTVQAQTPDGRTAVLVYARVPDAIAATYRTPATQQAGLTILGEMPYMPDTGVPDQLWQQVEATLASDAALQALYDEVYPRTPQTYTDPDTGQEITITPPFRFGSLAG